MRHIEWQKNALQVSKLRLQLQCMPANVFKEIELEENSNMQNLHNIFTMDTPQLNDHNKAEYPPMHTAEHILNQTMVRRYGCPRSRNAHIERKKSKVSYELPTCPSDAEVQEIVDKVNEVIQSALSVTVEYVTLENVPAEVSLEKLPSDASDTIRLVRIGDYDVCACIGAHVANTSEIGTFTLLGTNWDEEKKSFRIRFKLA